MGAPTLIFLYGLSEFATHGFSNVPKDLAHRHLTSVLYLLTFVLKKLLVELIDDFCRPSSDLIANQVDVLLPIIYDLLLLL